FEFRALWNGHFIGVGARIRLLRHQRRDRAGHQHAQERYTQDLSFHSHSSEDFASPLSRLPITDLYLTTEYPSQSKGKWQSRSPSAATGTNVLVPSMQSVSKSLAAQERLK